MFSDHLYCESVPRAFALGLPPNSLPEVAPRHATVRLSICEGAPHRLSHLVRAWRRHPQLMTRAFTEFLSSPFNSADANDHKLAHEILSDLFHSLVGKPLRDCVVILISSHEVYRNLIRVHEPDPLKHNDLSHTDGCFVGGYIALIKADRPRRAQPATPKTWSSVLRCALHEIGHRVFWPTEENYIGSEVAAEYFAYAAWKRLRSEALATGADIGGCRASQDSNYRRISLAAEELVELTSCRT